MSPFVGTELATRPAETLSRDYAPARRVASSRRRTSRSVIGMPARPIAPQTQSAHWKPPVNAAGAVEPAAVRVLKWLAATVDAIATPIAPPICWLVLSRPEGRPASGSARPA